MGLQAYDGTQWTGIGGGAETYSVFAESTTSVVTVTKTATVSIPAGTYITSQLSTVTTNNSLFDSNTLTGSEDKPIKFSGTVTSVSVTLKPNIVLASTLNTWTTRTSQFGTSDVQAITFGDNLFIAVGNNGKVSTSTDGITWATRTANAGTSNLFAVAYGAGATEKYVLGGNSGNIRSSTDGITWTTRTSQFGGQGVFALAHGNGTYVAGGQAGLLSTSTDGITWVTRTSTFGTSIIYSLTFGNGLFVAGGDLGFLRTSTNGTTWTTRTSTTTSTIYSLHYDSTSGKYYYGAGNGILGISTDGITWTSKNLSSQLPNDILSFTNYENVLVIGNETGKYVLSADDAQTFVLKSFPIVNKIFALEYNNGLFIAGGATGFIFTSDDIGLNPSTLATVFTKLDAVEAS